MRCCIASQRLWQTLLQPRHFRSERNLGESMSNAANLEECGNCGRLIGRLETPCVFEDEVVCSECFARLSPAIECAAPFPRGSMSPSALSAADHATVHGRMPAPIPVVRSCPLCGSTERAVKKSKGSGLLLIILLLLWILPGLIYLMVYSGYVYVCPACGFKYGDAK